MGNGDIESTEKKRQLKQNEVDVSKTKKDRNKLGQFSTPRSLADDLLAYAKTILDTDKVRFLDPAFGMGSFYTALVKNFGKNVEALGFEIDKQYFSAAKEVWKEFIKLQLENADFTGLKAENYKKANLLVCNPPYIRHQHLEKSTKERLKREAQQITGLELSGLAGLHAYFMLLCHEWLDDEGLAMWLVPSEILEVNYGKKVRDYLLHNVRLERVHFFDHLDGQFSDALVSSCIIIYRKASPAANHAVEISAGSSFLQPEEQISFLPQDLNDKAKWSKHLLKEANAAPSVASGKLGDLFTIKRGIATGDNSFFVLTKEQALTLGLPKKYLHNLLPSSRFLKSDVIGLDEEGFLDVDKKLVLLDIDLSLEEIQQCYPRAYGYLQEGIARGVDKGYLTSRRSPWYSQEKRQPPQYFVRYMNRESKDGSMHPIFIKNEADALATNSYLMLYEKPLQIFETIARDEKKMWDALRKGLDKTLYKHGRTYGGGLVKFEPGELKEIPIAP